MNFSKQAFFALALFTFGGVACGAPAAGTDSNPTSQEALSEVGGSYCAKMQECAPSSFATVYPGGIADCMRQVTAGAPASGGRERCTAVQVDTCARDIKSATCASTLASSALPASCSGC